MSQNRFWATGYNVIAIPLAMLVLAVVLPFVCRVLRSQPCQTASASPEPVARFPWWGWLGVFITVINWVLAWNRFSWFAPLQPFTFSPFWFGYILIVNGLTWRRTGQCMLRNRPGYTLRLFVISAVFWWYFEYLNRFVQNWHYEGIGELSGMQYFIYATLPFSTVLPALAALICGFFWELWNLHSQAKWIYSVPFVDRFKLFEMPILGYAGYLPFGLECAVVADFLLRPGCRYPDGKPACRLPGNPRTDA